ncbi:phage minor capsid protein [Parvimonas micra]
MTKQNNTIHYKGKEFSYYEATQIQRQMERDIRNIKKSILMYNEIDD